MLSHSNRLKKQLDFIIEVDKVKNVFRQTFLMDGKRFENDAEHSWHLAVMVLLLLEYADIKSLDMLKVLKMVLLHDMVEIDAGDTYCYDAEAARDKSERETRAANRIFGMLPDDQCREFRALWDEFEMRKTPESRFAAAMDRLQPLLHNYMTNGAAWQAHGITHEMVIERNRHIADGSLELWQFAESLIRDAVRLGYLP